MDEEILYKVRGTFVNGAEMDRWLRQCPYKEKEEFVLMLKTLLQLCNLPLEGEE